jgi:hypothetical protein
MSLCRIDIDVPNGKLGDWEIFDRVVTREEAAMNNLRQWFNHGSRHVRPGTYKVLTYKGEAMMSNTPAEIADHVPFIARACGDILINGLGLGVALTAILKKPDVSSVTIVEVSEDLIALVASTYLKDRRVKIIHDDAFAFKIPRKPEKYDTVFHDIWQHISAANLPEMAKLHRKYAKRCWWQDSWCRAECRKEARKELAFERTRGIIRLYGGFTVTRKSWQSIKPGRTIYSARCGRPRKVLTVSRTCIGLEPLGGVGKPIIYCQGDKGFFMLSKGGCHAKKKSRELRKRNG